jgi:Rab GTPase-activating protein 1
MNDAYRILLPRESKSEKVIIRDINRTFPGHPFFQEELGQQALYKLSKAYSIYDQEVGYCQGLSFLIATLLLHMPEEQAFNILVKIMYRYEVREIYKTNFECLQMRFHQLDSLMQSYLPELYEHFADLNIEAHM